MYESVFILCLNCLDVCGFVVAVYEKGMEGVEDISKRELVVVIEDTGVLAVRYAFDYEPSVCELCLSVIYGSVWGLIIRTLVFAVSRACSHVCSMASVLTW